MKDNLYIFPDSVNRLSEKESLKLDINDKIFNLKHEDNIISIDTSLLRDGSSTVVVNNPITNKTYALYNFREILQVMDMTPQEMLKTLGQRCFMQIDKSGGKVYVKVFLIKGMNKLESDTDDFSLYSHKTLDYIHELDWEYSWTIKSVRAKLYKNILEITFDTIISDFYKEPIYLSHAGQSFKVEKGNNAILFKYIDTEDVYIGSINSRYKGRCLDIKRLLEEGAYGL